jgi:hypothetical protein
MRLWLMLFWISILSVDAQQAELWTDVTIYKSITDKVLLFGDVGPRVPLSGNGTTIFYIRPSVSYQPGKTITLGGGLALFASENEGQRVVEYRGWQGVRADVKLASRIQFNNHARLEERFFTGDTNNDFALRFRVLSGFTFLLNNSSLQNHTLYLVLSGEVFEDLNDKENFFFNRRRYYAGLGYVFNSALRAEVFYIENSARAIPENDFEPVDVIRIRLHLTLPSTQYDNKG